MPMAERKIEAVRASVLFPLTDICPECGTGHIETPCQGGTRCTCCCRKCSARFHHKLARPLPEDAE